MSFRKPFRTIIEYNMPNTQERASTNVCSICGEESSNLKRGENGKRYCSNCITREHLIKCSHDGCNKYLQPDEILIAGSGYLCKAHWDKIYTFCSSCGAIIKKEYSYETSDGKYLCNHCFDESYFQCSDCGKVGPISEKIELEIDGSVKTICKKCKKENYTECSHCHQLSHRSQLIRIEVRSSNGGRKLIHCCTNCVSSIAHRCNNCGNWFENNIQFHDDCNCDECYYRRGEIIHPYNYKPEIKPQKAADENDSLLFGTELEIELNIDRDDSSRDWEIRTNSGNFNVDYKKYIAFHIDNAIPGFFYQKSDGSIHFGMEIVSHPATLEFWHSQENQIEGLFNFLRSEKCQGDKAPSVGMHIHVTRNQMKRVHQNGFAAFVYSHKDKIENLAGRKSNSYTKMIPISNLNPEIKEQEQELERRITHNDDRYSAVNWKNSQTVELRMFQSTLNTHKFLANIEFSHALYYFSKEHSVIECINETSWKSFCSFINEKECYKYLKEMMTDKDIFEIL